MFTSWNCRHCELINRDNKLSCQACFNASNELSPLKSIEYKQDLLLYGYLRLHISNNNKPIDIIHLCLKFYKVNIKISNHLSTTKQQAVNIMPIAKQFWDNCDTYISTSKLHSPGPNCTHTHTGTLTGSVERGPSALPEVCPFNFAIYIYIHMYIYIYIYIMFFYNRFDVELDFFYQINIDSSTGCSEDLSVHKQYGILLKASRAVSNPY